MLDDILVIDDIIPKTYQDVIEQSLFSSHFPWYLQKDITFIEDKFDNYGFNHGLKLEDGTINSAFYDGILPMTFLVSDRYNLEQKNLVQARAFLQTNRGRKTHNKPHVDLHYPHTVFLYYVNDSDGDTFLFEETLEDTPNPQKDYQFNLKQSISPKKGRGVIFNGNRYHASSNPTKIPRCVINFDLN